VGWGLTGLLLFVGTPAFGAGAFELFDGERRGFVLSGNAGLLPVVSLTSRDVQPSISESSIGFGFGGLAGIGVTESDVIGFSANVVFIRQMDARQTQSFGAGTWLHYFGPPGESMVAGLLVGSVTRSSYSYSCGLFGPGPCPPVMPPDGSGLGVGLEFGYEFKGIQLMGHGLVGRVKDRTQDIDFSVGEFGLEVQWLRY
jgi:hypothetical protein